MDLSLSHSAFILCSYIAILLFSRGKINSISCHIIIVVFHIFLPFWLNLFAHFLFFYSCIWSYVHICKQLRVHRMARYTRECRKPRTRQHRIWARIRLVPGIRSSRRLVRPFLGPNRLHILRLRTRLLPDWWLWVGASRMQRVGGSPARHTGGVHTRTRRVGFLWR